MKKHKKGQWARGWIQENIILWSADLSIQKIRFCFCPYNAMIIANPCNIQTTLGIFVIKNTAAHVTDFDVVILDKRTKTIIGLALSVRFRVTFVGPLAVQVPLAVVIHTESIYITHFDFELGFSHAMKLPFLLGISASQLAQQSNARNASSDLHIVGTNMYIILNQHRVFLQNHGIQHT